eukprot:2369846-Rhodomonas_salina.3
MPSYRLRESDPTSASEPPSAGALSRRGQPWLCLKSRGILVEGRLEPGHCCEVDRLVEVVRFESGQRWDVGKLAEGVRLDQGLRWMY